MDNNKKHIGIQTIVLDHSVIGYVHSGTKTIHADQLRWTIAAESIYYLPNGIYRVENMPNENQLFDEVIFTFSP